MAFNAVLRMAAGAAVSGAVVLAVAWMMATGWHRLDPAVVTAVSVLIAFASWALLRSSLRLGLDGVPDGINTQVVATWIGDRPGVSNVRGLQIRALSTTGTAEAVHIAWQGADADASLDRIPDDLHHDFGFGHVTPQFERAAQTSAPYIFRERS